LGKQQESTPRDSNVANNNLNENEQTCTKDPSLSHEEKNVVLFPTTSSTSQCPEKKNEDCTNATAEPKEHVN
jgi:hypothetical protein